MKRERIMLDVATEMSGRAGVDGDIGRPQGTTCIANGTGDRDNGA